MVTHIKYLVLLSFFFLTYNFFASEDHTFSVILTRLEPKKLFVINQTEKMKKPDGSLETTTIEYGFYEGSKSSESYVYVWRDINKDAEMVFLSILQKRAPELFKKIEILKKACLKELETKTLDLLRTLKKDDLENINSIQDSEKQLPAKLYILFNILFTEFNNNRWQPTINWNGPHQEERVVFEYPHNSTVANLKNIIRKQLRLDFNKITISENNRPLANDQIMPNIGIFVDSTPFTLKIEQSKLRQSTADDVIAFQFLNPPIFLNNHPLNRFDLSIKQVDKLVTIEANGQSTQLSDNQAQAILQKINEYKTSNFADPDPRTENVAASYELFKSAVRLWAQNTNNSLTLKEEVLAEAPAKSKQSKKLLTQAQPVPSVPSSSVQQPWSWYKDLFSYDKWSTWLQRQKNNLVKNRNYILGILGVGTVVGAHLYSQHQKGNLWQPTPPAK